MDPRYMHPGIAGIWSRKRQLRLWAQVECAWMAQLDTKAAYDARCRPVPTPEELADLESVRHHEFVAFLELWSDRFETEEARRWVHYGLTSSDVIDAATALQIKNSHALIAALGDQLLIALRGAEEKSGTLLQVGRTHGQHAQPRLLSVGLQSLFWTVQRWTRRLALAIPDALEVDFSGPTGGRESLNPRAVGLALESLGLHRAIASTQIVPRDSWVHWLQIVSNLTTACAAIAHQYWLWAQSEVGEVEVLNGAGSSAMPHKVGNPHVAENVQGLARLSRGLISTVAESMIQSGDRDLIHSSVERVAIPDVLHLAATALTRTISIVTDYQFAPERVEANLVAALEQRVDSAIRTADLVREGYSRDEAISTTRNEESK
jgi:adenylosuccinate lyase